LPLSLDLELRSSGNIESSISTDASALSVEIGSVSLGGKNEKSVSPVEGRLKESADDGTELIPPEEIGVVESSSPLEKE
jgi:hypothetical protein